MEYQEGTIRKCKFCGTPIKYSTRYGNRILKNYWVDSLNPSNDFRGWRGCNKGETPHEPLDVTQILERYEV